MSVIRATLLWLNHTQNQRHGCAGACVCGRIMDQGTPSQLYGAILKSQTVKTHVSKPISGFYRTLAIIKYMYMYITWPKNTCLRLFREAKFVLECQRKSAHIEFLFVHASTCSTTSTSRRNTIGQYHSTLSGAAVSS